MIKSLLQTRKQGLLAFVSVVAVSISAPHPVSADSIVLPVPASLSSAVRNFDVVSSGILRGAQPDKEALQALSNHGVMTIIDLRMPGVETMRERTAAKKLGLNYHHFPMALINPSEEKIKKVLAVATNPANQPVYIHCRQGADRTGMVCGIYRRTVDGWSFDRTYEEMRSHHFKPFLSIMKDRVRDASTKQYAASTEISKAAQPDTNAPIAAN